MVIIESIKNYVDKISDEELLDLSTRIYMITDFICKDYPKYKEWYFTKQLPKSLTSDSRNILFVRDVNNENKIQAMACLKKDKEEKKICTLFVSNESRGLGIGTKIIESSMQWLETTKPLITLADYKLNMFKPIIEKYNWDLTEIVFGLYNNKYEELCFNGTLIQSNDITLKKQLQKKLIMVLKERIESINKQ